MASTFHLGYLEAGVFVDVDVGHRPFVSDGNKRSAWVHREAAHPATVQAEDDASLHRGYLKDPQSVTSGVHHLARLDVFEVVWSCRVQPKGMVWSDVVSCQLAVLVESEKQDRSSVKSGKIRCKHRTLHSRVRLFVNVVLADCTLTSHVIQT